jgi:hypothetical protein
MHDRSDAGVSVDHLLTFDEIVPIIVDCGQPAGIMNVGVVAEDMPFVNDPSQEVGGAVNAIPHDEKDRPGTMCFE